ncbi:DEAD/DEAH box helicase [Lactobacillus plantarum] [Lacticaseibacillus rhamnosus]|nr:DEAD/DEAH box helicase [Lactobacillus plantarum] [Lacticaseibacillus rhamnosus]
MPSRGLGDVYKRQDIARAATAQNNRVLFMVHRSEILEQAKATFTADDVNMNCLLYTSDAADDTPCVDLGGRRIIKKKIYKL